MKNRIIRIIEIFSEPKFGGSLKFFHFIENFWLISVAAVHIKLCKFGFLGNVILFDVIGILEKNNLHIDNYLKNGIYKEVLML